ncbi:hypothetical protein F5141DRAFT_660416 [Pisolithus sp. B1]|nr:hypothetical protein F5141DRAFT_660416 [Pisolithus sp. B1]
MSSSEIQCATDDTYDISYSPSIYSESSDSPDELSTPSRSPSRLDFCVEAYEEYCKWYDSQNTIPLLWNAADEHGTSLKSPHQESTKADDKRDGPVEYLIQVLVSGLQDPLCEEPETRQSDPVSDMALSMRSTTTRSLGPLSTAEKLQRVRGKKQREPCHHGLSRNALFLKKRLWDSRLYKWRALWDQASTWQHPVAGDRTRSPYPMPPPTTTPPSGLERDMEQHASRWCTYDLQSPIYPRAGDILALRDSHAAEMDKSFFEYPLWTIQKALYLFDMYDRFTRPFIVTDADETEMQSCSAHTLELAHSDAYPNKQTNAQPHTPPPETVTWGDFRPWERSWYARWAVLENLVQRSHLNSLIPPSPTSEATESSSESDSSRLSESPSVQSTWEDSVEDIYGNLAADALFSKRFVDEWD